MDSRRAIIPPWWEEVDSRSERGKGREKKEGKRCNVEGENVAESGERKEDPILSFSK